MKAQMLCLFFVTVFAASSALADAQRAGDIVQTEIKALPRLTVAETVFDFGAVRQGSQVDHRFTLKNTGVAPLKIERMHTSCGCTAAVIATDTIAPGAQTDLKFTFDTAGFQGPKMKTVRLYTNDPKQPSVVFTLQGDVKPDVELSVPRLHFGDIRHGQSPALQLTVSAPPGSDVRIQDVTTRSQYIDVKTEDLAGASGKKISVKLKNTLPVGVFRDRIVVKTTSGNNPVVNIPVVARVQGDLRLAPSSLSFGLLDGPLKQTVSQTVQIENSSRTPVKVTSVESDNPAISAELIPLKDGKSVGIKVTLREDLLGAFRARVKVITDNADADQRQLVLPVYGIISRSKAS